MAFLPFFISPNLSAKKVDEGYPWDFVVANDKNWLKAMEKSKRRKALLQLDCLWNCYSAIRGQNSSAIISGDNPPVAIRGLVCDYDMKATLEEVFRYIDQIPQHLHPNFVEISLGGKIRLVWIFEREVLVPSPEFCRAVLEAFVSKIGAGTLLAGFDPASLKPTERWSNGAQWTTPIKQTPLAWDFCFGVLCEVSLKKTLFSHGQIPLNEIGEEVKARWPGRWEGEFILDAQGVRFWDDKADNPTGCQIKPDGMLCFTGGVPFKKWEELLGKAWCDERRVMNLGRAAENIFFDGKFYWECVGDRWMTTQRPDILVRLRGRGLSDTREKGETQSDCEKVFDHIQQNNRVEGAAPFINYKPGLVEVDGFRFLNNAYLKPTQPKQGPTGDPQQDWPFLAGLLTGLLARPELNPLDHLLYWIKVGYMAMLNHDRAIGQAVFLCGPRNNGKTLFCDKVLTPLLGGRVANPMDFFTGSTVFNDELFAAGLLAINDEDSPRNEGERQKMAQRLKAFVVNSNHTFHPKFCARLNIKWTGRVFVTLNDDAGSVGILPEVNKNTQDKLMFFASQPYQGVWPSIREIESRLEIELPYFAQYLIDYEPPAEVIDQDIRGNVKSYFDPVILTLSQQQMYSYNFEELIRAWMKVSPYWSEENKDEWIGSPTDLLTDIGSYESLRSVTREWTQYKAAKALTSLAKQGSTHVEFAPNTGREFIIRKTLLD